VLGGFGVTPAPGADSRARLWHFGQGFFKLHVRFPHTVRM
jgi:hypothetical protein